jgi:hypothetical protein
MIYEGVLTKMKTELTDTVQYYLVFEQDFLHVNQIINKTLSINFIHYYCLNCQKEKKVFTNGVCYQCFSTLPQMGDWVMRPELSTAHLGQEDRDLEYEQQAQLQPHIVYLANSSNVKVGVTRKSQVPTRWIDQGAHEAIEVVEVPNRYLAGITEVALKEHVSDKTNWRRMLTNDLQDLDLGEIKHDLKQYLPQEVQEYYLANSKELEIHFPVVSYPSKCKSLNLQKTPYYEGVLKGIKGQYLLFEDGTVFNVRKHEGFGVSLTIK